MDFVGLALGLVKLLQGFMTWLGNKQLLTAGEALAANRSLDGTMEILTNAKKAADHVRRDPYSDYSKRLRDKYRRPD